MSGARPRDDARAPRRTTGGASAWRRSPHARNRAAVERTLARAGFSDGFVRELTDTALAHTLALAPRIGLVPAVRAALAQRIPPARPLPATGCSIVVVGAGGSGKTTCCAALLGAYRAHSTLPARFATLVRPESQTELQLMMSPQMLEPQPADSPRARRELRSAGSDGVVVIDTPRLSPSEPGGIRELGRLLGELEPDRIVVALPVTLGAVAAEQLLASLEPIGPAALALTHADETDQLGVGIELACRFGLAPELMVEHAAGRRLAPAAPRSGRAGRPRSALAARFASRRAPHGQPANGFSKGVLGARLYFGADWVIIRRVLILTRRPGERVVIGEDIFVSVMSVSGHSVRLGIEAPGGVPIYREEIWHAVRDENRAAADADAGPVASQPARGRGRARGRVASHRPRRARDRARVGARQRQSGGFAAQRP